MIASSIRLYCWLLATWGLTLAMTAHGAELVLRQRLIPTGPIIHLGDIADIHAADGVEARRLATLPLWTAPPEGEVRMASRASVRDAVRLNGIDPEGLELSGATRVTIGSVTPSAVSSPEANEPESARQASERSSQLLGTGFRPPRERLAMPDRETKRPLLGAEREELIDQLREEVLYYLEQASGKGGHLDVELRLSHPQIALMAQQPDAVVISGGRVPWTGRQLLTAKLLATTGNQEFTFVADVLDTTPVVVTKRPLLRGQTITAADIELQVPTRDMRLSASRPLVRSLDEALGLETSRALRPGEILTSDLCLAPLMIERNQIVTVTMAGGGIELSRNAKALSDARLGEFTEVLLLNSKERLAGRVVGAGKLAIADTGSTTIAAPSSSRPRRYQP